MEILLAAGVDPSNARPGYVAMAIVFGLAIVVALLVWSMSKQLKKVDFDEGDGKAGIAPRKRDTEDE